MGIIELLESSLQFSTLSTVEGDKLVHYVNTYFLGKEFALAYDYEPDNEELNKLRVQVAIGRICTSAAIFLIEAINTPKPDNAVAVCRINKYNSAIEPVKVEENVLWRLVSDGH